MTNHPNRNRTPKTEVDGVRFKLAFDTAGNPHMLKRWQQDHAGRWHWGIIWAAGYGGKPTGTANTASMPTAPTLVTW